MSTEWTPPEPTWSKTCETCEEGTVKRFRGQGDVECPSCGQPYNACGQRLNRNWADNRSNYDDEVSDLDGYEVAALRRDEE